MKINLTQVFLIFKGSWEEWSKWSSCNSTCGKGFINRTRVCNSEFLCPGNKIEFHDCYSNKTCQGKHSEKMFKL